MKSLLQRAKKNLAKYIKKEVDSFKNGLQKMSLLKHFRHKQRKIFFDAKRCIKVTKLF